MKKIRLLTSDGRFVSEVEMPAFVLMPEVVCWGARIFQKSDTEDEYREVFAYLVPVTLEG